MNSGCACDYADSRLPALARMFEKHMTAYCAIGYW